MNGVVADEITPMPLCAHQAVQAAMGLLPFCGVFLLWLMGAART